MCCSAHRFEVPAATHYHTRAWQTLILYGKECFILLLQAECSGRIDRVLDWEQRVASLSLTADRVAVLCP